MKAFPDHRTSVAIPLILLAAAALPGSPVSATAEPRVSAATRACLGCHATVTPGIVEDWRASRMARVSPAEGLAAPPLERRISAEGAPEGLADTVVGCAECHTMRPDAHPDTFDHNGFRVHIVVTPEDCATCHPVERAQYAQNLMSHAHGNLVDNPLYAALAEEVNAVRSLEEGVLQRHAPDALTSADSCLACHGTRVEVQGRAPRPTAMGEMSFPVLSGWPNQGVGRVNPDGSLGACTSCHARHRFSVEVARKPHTCGQCHKGPDVPAYPVYLVSKHGNLYESLHATWSFDAVPWVPGRDFSAPTCAACHVSLTATAQGRVIAERTHRMNDRSRWRLFGPLYAHAHPRSPDTSRIRNGAGLPLPAELTGEPAAAFLIDGTEQAARGERMAALCRACHSRQWVDGHFTKLERTVETTNAMTLAATRLVLSAWDKGLAQGPVQGDSLFNEALEKKWVQQWLFYANSTRFASAMGGADYGVFAHGRHFLSQNLQEMAEWLRLLERTAPAPP